jgi:hypothetical protein
MPSSLKKLCLLSATVIAAERRQKRMEDLEIRINYKNNREVSAYIITSTIEKA